MGVIETDYHENPLTHREAILGARLLGGSLFPQTTAASPNTTAHSSLPQRSGSFRAILQAGETISLPEQVFDFHSSGEGWYLQSNSTSHWPGVRIVPDTATPGWIEVDYLDQSVEACLLRTRLLYVLHTEGKFYLRDHDGNSLLEIAVERMAPQEFEYQIILARTYRQLRFIEDRFRTAFVLPDRLTARDHERIELVFRGITEGEFSSRSDEITFRDYSPSPAELKEPPFSRPGRLSRTSPNPYFQLLGQSLLMGARTITLERAVLANPREFGNKGNRGSALRFVILDSQIRYRFEIDAQLSAQERSQRLERFRTRLLEEEPQALAELLTERLSADVTPEEAIQIAHGWLQFYDFPDRYNPQNPVLEGDKWRVPVWITYPTVRGAKVEDLFVSVKTGVINAAVTPAEMRELGTSIASKILRAS
jgi:hypothetical protein